MKCTKALALLSLLACADKHATAVDTGEDNADITKVLFIGIDGLRADGIAGAEAPNMTAMISQGAYSLQASTQQSAPTVSGPGWTSMLTGVDSDKHGIVGNGGYDNINRFYPTLIGRTHALGLSTATAIHWVPIQLNLIEHDVTDEMVLGTDAEVADGMAALLEGADHDVHFAALDDVDHAGHSSGFLPDNPEYQDAIATADSQVGQLLDAIEARTTRDTERWLVALTSDHGGDADGHGSLNDANRTIPLLLWGDGVVLGEIEGEFISHMDVHPTLLTHLGHPPQSAWDLDGVARGIETQ